MRGPLLQIFFVYAFKIKQLMPGPNTKFLGVKKPALGGLGVELRCLGWVFKLQASKDGARKYRLFLKKNT